MLPLMQLVSHLNERNCIILVNKEYTLKVNKACMMDNVCYIITKYFENIEFFIKNIKMCVLFTNYDNYENIYIYILLSNILKSKCIISKNIQKCAN